MNYANHQNLVSYCQWKQLHLPSLSFIPGREVYTLNEGMKVKITRNYYLQCGK
jgi:hypothetical protein